jgi:ribosome-binding protein aMBF1 (putative translation factor)
VRTESEVIDLVDGRRSKSAQLSGLALIEHLYFRAGQEAAQGQLQRLLGADQSARSFALCDTGQPAVGTNTVPGDDISYETFSPPVSWNAVYSVQRIRLGPKAKSDFLFHPGEEILIPTSGEVAYHFFWSPGASPPERFLLNPPATAGQILRINPQIPHHAWSSKGEATAWLVMRHTMNSPVALVMNQDSSALSSGNGESTVPRDARTAANVRAVRRRRVTASNLRKPGAYAMIAWGISELIRDSRLKAGLTPTDLARQIGIDPSSISRLEEAKANVSIEMLAKVCGALRIGMAECMESGSWIYERDHLDAKQWDDGRIVHPPRGSHFLHFSVLHLAKGEHRSVPTGLGLESSPFTSWIVLSGRLMADLPETMGNKSLILDASNVLHFRKYGDVALQALQDSTIVQVVYSPICECNSRGLS